MSSQSLSKEFIVTDQKLANLLFGQQNRHLKLIESSLSVRIGSQGNRLVFKGEASQVQLAHRLCEELYSLLQEGYSVYPQDIDYATRILNADSAAHLKDIFLDTVFISARNKYISPKSVAQKRISMLCGAMILCLALGQPVPGKHIWRWRWLSLV